MAWPCVAVRKKCMTFLYLEAPFSYALTGSNCAYIFSIILYPSLCTEVQLPAAYFYMTLKITPHVRGVVLSYLCNMRYSACIISIWRVCPYNISLISNHWNYIYTLSFILISTKKVVQRTPFKQFLKVQYQDLRNSHTPKNTTNGFELLYYKRILNWTWFFNI